MGCHEEPPADVAHLQFASRIAFKGLGAKPETFVLLDDAGALLASGTPSGTYLHYTNGSGTTRPSETAGTVVPCTSSETDASKHDIADELCHTDVREGGRGRAGGRRLFLSFGRGRHHYFQ